MTARLSDKVAIITGGASGIGRASVLRFLEHGARVVFGDLNQAKAQETLQLAAAVAPTDRVCFVRCDVAHEPDVAALVQRALTQFGQLDCMFNNAGMPGALGPISEISSAAWDRTFAVLVGGVFLGIKYAARALSERGGTIINTASVAAFSAGVGPTAYSACKAAVVSVTRSAAVELAPARIRVNALCPGLIRTPLLEREQPGELEVALQQGQPWPEAGLPEHIADAALFLASDESRFVTGEALVVDGGLCARGPGVFARGSVAGKAIANSISHSLSAQRSSDGSPISFDPGSSE